MKTFVMLKSGVIKLLIVMVCAVATGVASAQDNLVLQTDFEKGTQKWEARGARTVSIKTTKEEAAAGDKSLRVRGRTENWQGAQLNITRTLKPGVNYRFTVSVKLAAGEEPDDIKMTVQRGDNQFEGVASSKVTDREWSTIAGRFRTEGKDPYLLVYIEATRERTSYFIDEFKIEVLEAPKQSGTIVKSDFQDGTAQNWLVRGENVQIFSALVGNTRSLKVGGRTESWHGLALDLSPVLYKGRTYDLSVQVKMAEGEGPDSLKMSIMETAPDGTAKVVEVAGPTTVGDEEWVTLSGEYKSTSDGSGLVLLIEAKGAKSSYYIDDFELKIP